MLRFFAPLIATALLLSACGGEGGVSTPFGTKQIGAVGVDTSGNSTATDASGNVYVAGRTKGGLDGNSLTGTEDFFLTKYSATGSKLYTKQMGVVGVRTGANSVATDASGNAYVTGYTYGGLDGNLLTGTADFFVTKYDSSGSKIYTKQMGVAGVHTSGHSIATDTSGNAYVTGQTFGGLDGNSLTGTSDFFLIKYNASGARLYTKQMGVGGVITHGDSVATDGNGNVYVTGTTLGGLDGNILTGFPSDLFLTKYDATGNKLYTRQLGVSGASTHGNSVATDGNGNVYVTGRTLGGLEGSTVYGNIMMGTPFDAFLTKYNSSGTKLYTKQIGTTGAGTEGASVATDTNGNVYITGQTSFGLVGLTSTALCFFAKYDDTGSNLYTKWIGVTGAHTAGNSVAIHANDNIYVTGSTTGGLDGNTLTGTSDFFLVKFDSAGSKK